MKRIFAQFLLSILQVVMIFTLTLAPVPFMEKVSAVYAQDDVRDDCEEDQNDNGRPGVYKPGCDFNEALVKAQENSSGDGMVGVIEQFAAAAFGLAAINSVAFTVHPMSVVDCPGYINPQVTLRLMQVGSLAYIVGNIQSNQKFKQAAIDAVDVELTPQAKRDERVEDKDLAVKNRKFNQKQLDSYMALIKVYEAKVSALEKKKNMAMLAELAYLGALGTEGIMTTAHSGKCTAGTTKDETTDAAITAIAQVIPVQAAAVSSTGLGAAFCASTVITGEAKTLVQVQAEAKTKALAATNVAEDTKTAVAEAGIISKLFASFASVFSLGVTGFFAMNASPFTSEIKALEDKAEIARNTGLFTSIVAEQTAATATLLPDALKCPATAASVAELESLELSKATPYICCGTRVAEVPNGFSIVTPAPGKIWIENDVIIPPLFSASNENLDYLKYITYGFLQDYQTRVIESKNISPDKKVELFKKMYKQLDQFELNFESILSSPEFKQELAGIKFDSSKDDLTSEQGIKNFFKKVKLNIISEAKAGFMGELLGLGVKMLALQFAMGSFMRNTALTSPKNRMITFGVMAAINAGVMKFNGDSASEAKRRLEIVKNEARSFAESHALKTSFDEDIIELSKKASPEELAKLNAALNNGIVTCADPKGNSFVPAQCPSKSRPNNFNLPLDPNTKRRLNNTPLGRALPLISDAAYNATSGKSSGSSSSTKGGSLTELGKIQGAVRKQVDGIVEDFDKSIGAKYKDKFGLKTAPLASSNLKFRKLYNGDPAKNGVSKSMLAGLEGKLADIDDIKEQTDKSSGKVAAYTPPKFDAPKTDSFKFDLGGDSGTIVDNEQRPAALQESELSDFQVNAADVNERTDANIFKIISNRYLKSYPVLLEERE